MPQIWSRERSEQFTRDRTRSLARPRRRVCRGSVVALVVAAPTFDQTPAFQPIEPTHNCGTGYVHIGSDLRYRKRLALDVTNGHACGYQESFYTCAKSLAGRLFWAYVGFGRVRI